MTKIRVRVRGPNGVTSIQAEDDWKLEQLIELIKEKTGVASFSLKYGWPLKAMETDDAKHQTLAGFKLNGETLVVEPLEAPSAAFEDTAAPPAPSKGAGSAISVAPGATAAALRSPLAPRRLGNKNLDDVMVEWPERDGMLLLRVMADDNSCLFTAFGGAVQIDDPSAKLRGEIAKYIEVHPDVYTKVILDNMEPSRYIKRLLDTDSWGGAIEMGILSEIFDIQICSIDVESLRIDRFGEEKATRCIIVYSGIHYDRIVFVPGFVGPNAPAEFDETRWDTSDDEVLLKAVELAGKLNKQKYYVNSSTYVVRCETCQWIGAGDKQALAHTKETGHIDFGEMEVD